jgi:hypothetical protein
MTVIAEIGDGANTVFRKDRWLAGKNVQDIAPRLYALVSKRAIGRCTVLEALINDKWAEDIRGSIFLKALVEYLLLWDMISEVELQVGYQTSIFACVSLILDSTQQNQLMTPYSRVLSTFGLLKGSGNLGLHLNAASLCG